VRLLGIVDNVTNVFEESNSIKKLICHLEDKKGSVDLYTFFLPDPGCLGPGSLDRTAPSSQTVSTFPADPFPSC
jgi:hypothetical protein